MGVAVAAKNGIKSEEEVEKGEQRTSRVRVGSEGGRAGLDLDLRGIQKRCWAAGFSLHAGLELSSVQVVLKVGGGELLTFLSHRVGPPIDCFGYSGFIVRRMLSLLQ